MICLGVNIKEIDGTRELLRDLNSNYEILIATNGPKKVSIKKLEKAKLKSYISEIVCSEEIVFLKPMPEFFDFLLDKTKYDN